MTPRQQRAHLAIWLVLGPLLLLAIVIGTIVRPPAPTAAPQAREGSP